MKSFAFILALLAALIATGPARAVSFIGDYQVEVEAAGDATLIHTRLLRDQDPLLAFSLEPGGFAVVALFTLYTDATDVEALNGHSVTLNFQFEAPAMFGGTIDGTTIGHNFSGTMQWGQLMWSNGGWKLFDYGGGQLLVQLNNANFNKGLYGLRPGEGYAGTVTATFSLAQPRLLQAQAPTGAIPEPSQWAMLITGFGLLGARMRRRKGPARQSGP